MSHSESLDWFIFCKQKQETKSEKLKVIKRKSLKCLTVLRISGQNLRLRLFQCLPDFTRPARNWPSDNIRKNTNRVLILETTVYHIDSFPFVKLAFETGNDLPRKVSPVCKKENSCTLTSNFKLHIFTIFHFTHITHDMHTSVKCGWTYARLDTFEKHQAFAGPTQPNWSLLAAEMVTESLHTNTRGSYCTNTPILYFEQYVTVKLASLRGGMCAFIRGRGSEQLCINNKWHKNNIRNIWLNVCKPITEIKYQGVKNFTLVARSTRE